MQLHIAYFTSLGNVIAGDIENIGSLDSLPKDAPEYSQFCKNTARVQHQVSSSAIGCLRGGTLHVCPPMFGNSCNMVAFTWQFLLRTCSHGHPTAVCLCTFMKSNHLKAMHPCARNFTLCCCPRACQQGLYVTGFSRGLHSLVQHHVVY